MANRSPERAVSLAAALGGLAVPTFDAWTREALEVDILITSTAAPGFVRDQGPAGRADGRPQRPPRSSSSDIAVPRDVEPSANDVEGVYLYDIDSLQEIARQAMDARRQELDACERIIQDHVAEFARTIESRLGPEQWVCFPVRPRYFVTNPEANALTLGTRGSALALAQTALVLDALRAAWPGGRFEVREIKTTGDKRQDLSLTHLAPGGTRLRCRRHSGRQRGGLLAAAGRQGRSGVVHEGTGNRAVGRDDPGRGPQPEGPSHGHARRAEARRRPAPGEHGRRARFQGAVFPGSTCCRPARPWRRAACVGSVSSSGVGPTCG